MVGSIVWILGAGFSRPLGGLLLPQLLSTSFMPRMAAAFGDGAWWSEPRGLLELHARGIQGAIWQDAEEFLDVLDTAASRGPESPSGRLIHGLLQQGANQIQDAAG